MNAATRRPYLFLSISGVNGFPAPVKNPYAVSPQLEERPQIRASSAVGCEYCSDASQTFRTRALSGIWPTARAHVQAFAALPTRRTGFA
jgi:hypothetical protein